MNTESTQSTQTFNLAAEIESILRIWAQATGPEHDFSDYKVGVITRPLQHREGIFFAPGELVLFRPSAVLAPEGVTVTRPATAWSSWIQARPRPDWRAASNLAMSRPSSLAYWE